jgi:hypothetical protein
MSSDRNRVMEISLGVSVLLSLQLKSVQINYIHAIVFVHRLGSGAILSALVNAALEVEHHLILIERESLLFPNQRKHILAQSELAEAATTMSGCRHTGGLREKSE